MKAPAWILLNCTALTMAVIAPAHASETITYTYDAQGRLVGTSRLGTVNNGVSTSTTYDAASNRTNYSLNGGKAPPSFSIASATALEGAALSFTVTRSGDTTVATSVNWATANGTAVAGSDYTAGSGTLTFAAGETSKTVTVATLDDTLVESAETLTVTLSGASGLATISTATATGTINDNEAKLAVAGATVTEGGTLAFVVTRSGYTGATTSVNYATSNGTAVAPGDYTAASGTINFAAGETGKTISVTTVDDTLVESQESLNFTLSTPSANTVITSGTATGIINDNDVAPAYLSIGSASAMEGGALSFTVTRTGNTAIPASASYTTLNGSAVAGSDFNAASGTISFAAGETGKVITVGTIDDSAIEPTETMSVTLSAAAANVSISGATGTGTITDNDSSLAISGASANEGGVLAFAVTRSGYTANAASVSFSTANGSAVAGTNYTATSSTVNFAAGVTTQTVSVATQADQTWGGPLTMSGNLSAPNGGATISIGSAAGTINNTDAQPVLSVSPASASEGGSLGFVVTRSGALGNTVSATYSTANGTAIAGTNYTPSTGTVTFASGVANQTISVPTIRDGAITGDKAMSLSLSSPTGGAGLGTATATGTISDNDSTFSIADSSVNEGGLLTFVVTRSGYTGNSATVNFATANGSALAGTSYTATSGTLSFAPGVASQAISLQTAADDFWGGAINMSVGLSYPTGGASLARSVATGTLANVDPQPSISVAAATANEGDPLGFTFVRAGAAKNAVTVNYGVASGTAVVGTNVAAASGTVTFGPGTTGVNIGVPTLRDGVVTGNLAMTLVLSSPTGGAVVATPNVAGTIINVDAQPPIPRNPAVSLSSSGSTTLTLDALANVGGQPATIASFSPTSGSAAIAGGGQSVTFYAPPVAKAPLCEPATTITVTAPYTIRASNGTSGNGTATFYVTGLPGDQPRWPQECP